MVISSMKAKKAGKGAKECRMEAFSFNGGEGQPPSSWRLCKDLMGVRERARHVQGGCHAACMEVQGHEWHLSSCQLLDNHPKPRGVKQRSPYQDSVGQEFRQAVGTLFLLLGVWGLSWEDLKSWANWRSGAGTIQRLLWVFRKHENLGKSLRLRLKDLREVMGQTLQRYPRWSVRKYLRVVLSNFLCVHSPNHQQCCQALSTAPTLTSSQCPPSVIYDAGLQPRLIHYSQTAVLMRFS